MINPAVKPLVAELQQFFLVNIVRNSYLVDTFRICLVFPLYKTFEVKVKEIKDNINDFLDNYLELC